MTVWRQSYLVWGLGLAPSALVSSIPVLILLFLLVAPPLFLSMGFSSRKLWTVPLQTLRLVGAFPMVEHADTQSAHDRAGDVIHEYRLVA